jgi:tRNA U55 pseudouridine synthase TruB
MLYEYKKPGETMDQFIKRVKEKHTLKKVAYTARLDPMAKGIVPIAINDECSKIKELFNTKKTYQVKIIYGIQTDSDDPLGIIQNQKKITGEKLTIIKKSIIDYLNLINSSSFDQKYHYFSTKMLNHRRNKQTDVIDYHKVDLFDYNVLKEGSFDFKTWLIKITNQINSIDKTKNFRQEQTIKQWNNLDLIKLHYLKISLNVSSGFFVRQLINDISKNINIPLMCYSINRVSID